MSITIIYATMTQMPPTQSPYLPKAQALIDAFFTNLGKDTSPQPKPPIIAIIGPTATGKSDLAVAIAIYIQEKFSKTCEIISADSRQIYRHLNIGTGKITLPEMQNIPHHMLDICDPQEIYSVADYQEDANEVLKNIYKKNNIPIIVGGTGQYIDAVIYNQKLPEVPPNPELRKKLENESIENLLLQFEKLNNNQPHSVDLKNKRRVIRAIEILEKLGHIPQIDINSKDSPYNTLIIGLDNDDSHLREKIKTRLEARLKSGMIQESENLLEKGILTKERMQTLGLEYAYIADLLDKKIDIDEFKETLFFAIWHYAKRQRTWFRKNEHVFWITNV